jgi:MtN3 and saliva related transmembrane protein
MLTQPCSGSSGRLSTSSAGARIIDSIDLTAVLGPICTALSVSFVWPQVIRVYRLDTVEGLAPNGTLQGLAASALWAMYAIARGVGPLVVSNVVIGVALLMIAVAQIRHRALAVRKLCAVAVAITVIGGGALELSTTLAGWIAIVVGVTSILPQALYAARANDLSGVSLPMYALVLISCVLWSVYALLIGDWLIIITNMLIAPCALFVASKAWRFQYRPARLAAEIS